ncbi:MAG: hypothetical protein J7M32_01540 [Deltaproteobacteria bacterium]|nr:hypothetical protein [Deltaproteobacteria bacterium]
MYRLHELVEFREDLFFDGAVKTSWIESDPGKAELAARHFVFHGPSYHGVSESDVEISAAYKLTDTVSFLKHVVEVVSDPDKCSNNPFGLAIAGYGTGKSHLALTIACLLKDPTNGTSQEILKNILIADGNLGGYIRDKIEELNKPVLTVALNGMEDFDLAGELSRQLLFHLREYELDTKPLEDLTPRFNLALKFVDRNFEFRLPDFREKFGDDINKRKVIERLEDRDETAYKFVNDIFERATGTSIRAVGRESVQDLIATFLENYCGPGKKFKSLLIIFDEFGRYLEFATNRPHIAGDAALQQLFEAVQDNRHACYLLCLNQLELKAYVSRVAHEKRDFLNRYIGRYDVARKFYLSTNLETIFANLIQKKKLEVIKEEVAAERNASGKELNELLKKWFPRAAASSVWDDREGFNRVIVEGCWPLHPASTWMLYSLGSTVGMLQQRSAITFIAEAFKDYSQKSIEPGKGWAIRVVDLCSDALIEELVGSERHGQAQAFESVVEKYRHDLTERGFRILKAILVANKLGLKTDSRDETIEALAVFAGISPTAVASTCETLINEFGALDWDDHFKRFEIIEDALPRRAFIRLMEEKANETTDISPGELFRLYFATWMDLKDEDPDFAAQRRLSTGEWKFRASCCDSDFMQQKIINVYRDWYEAVDCETPRGQHIFCYVPSGEDAEEIAASVRGTLAEIAKKAGYDRTGLPILITLVHDENDRLANAMMQYHVLTKVFSPEEREKFANFISIHTDYLIHEMQNAFDELLKNKDHIWVTPASVKAQRLKRIMAALFEGVYNRIPPFEFDGFSTPRGNAAKDVAALTRALVMGQVNADWITSQPVKTRNRVNRLLGDACWGLLAESGILRRVAKNPILNELYSDFDSNLRDEQGLNLGNAWMKLIRPPYGCNDFSASVLIAAFIATRHETVHILEKGSVTDPAKWLENALKKNTFEKNVLSSSVLCSISDEVIDEWQTLLEEWDLAETYNGKVDFLQKALDLQERKTVPPVLYERYKRLETDSIHAKSKLNHFDDFIETQMGHLERQIEKENSGNLSRCAAELLKFIKKMEGMEKDHWLPEQVERLRRLYNEARVCTEKFFDEWLNLQSINRIQEVERFRHKMDRISENLRNINLPEDAEKLENHVNNEIHTVQESHRLSYILDEANAFVKSTGSLHRQATIKQLRENKKRCKDIANQLRQLEKIRATTESRRLLKAVEEIRNQADILLSEHRKRGNAIWESKIEDLNDVQNLAIEARLLEHIFAGEDIDVEAFRLMGNVLENVKRHWNELSNNEALSDSELKSLIRDKKAETEELIDEEDEVPWNIHGLYSLLKDSMMSERERLAKDWMDRNVEVIDLKTKDPMQIQNQLKRLENAPIFLSENQKTKVESTIESLNRKLDGLQVEGLLARFKSLSRQQQIQFLSEAQKLVEI